MWEKIVFNFLLNVFKFIFVGMIWVCVCDELMCVVFEVVDMGVGILFDELLWVFECFYCVVGMLGCVYEGSGIGFVLVSELVVFYGGEVGVESEVGWGIIFWVIFCKGFVYLFVECVLYEFVVMVVDGLVVVGLVVVYVVEVVCWFVVDLVCLDVVFGLLVL